MRFSRLLPGLLLLLLAACGSSGSPANLPASLPTAVPPAAGQAGGGWGISFAHEFPSEFWPEGIHRYGFHLQCPEAVGDIQDFGSSWQEFQVTEAIQPQVADTVAYLRLQGISRQPFAPALGEPTIHPRQPTVAIIHLIGLSREAAETARAECEVLLAWDQGIIQVLEPLELFQP